VEVLLREQDANLIEGLVRENRIDQRMPLEPDHRLLSPFRKSAWERVQGSPPKTNRQRSAQGDAVVRLTLFITHGRAASQIVYDVKGTPTRAFFIMYFQARNSREEQDSGRF